jgi:hypothetical protein
MSETLLEKNMVKLEELECCPIRLTIHSASKISQLEKIAKYNPNLLPSLEVAILKNNKKCLIKRHSVFEAIQRAGISEFKANIHYVEDLTDVVLLHARMSQSSPINPLAILDLRDYLIRNNIPANDISQICCLDLSYEKLLSCTLSIEAKNQLDAFLEFLSLKLNRVFMPAYIIEIIRKKPLHIQADIVRAIVGSMGDETTLNDKDFAFPNPEQIRIFADFYKKPEERNAIFFDEEIEYDENSTPQIKSKNYSVDVSIEKRKQINAIVGNVPHMAIMAVGNKKYRLDWKNKTFAEINERKNNKFILIKNNTQLQKLYAISSRQLKFLGLTEETEPFIKNITSSKQLRDLAEKIDILPGFRGIIIFNKKL